MQDIEEVTLEDQSKQLVQTGPFVTATFNNLQLKCLIDTGAQVSAMNKETYERIKQENIKIEIQLVENLQLIGAFSKKATKILFKTEVEFKINNAMFKQEILVVEKLIHEIVFGEDFLYTHSVSIQCGKDGIEIELESDH